MAYDIWNEDPPKPAPGPPATRNLAKRQFFKENPNQMALPGLEEHAHAGAPILAQGLRIEHRVADNHDLTNMAGTHTLAAVDDSTEYSERAAPHLRTAAKLTWNAGTEKDTNAGYKRGEITGVFTQERQRQKGIATQLYGVGRTMMKNVPKPEHSPTRTPDGDKFAEKSSGKYGGKIPRNVWA